MSGWVGANLFTLQALSRKPSWCKCGATSESCLKALMTMLYIWLRQMRTSHQVLSLSHSFGVRSRHVSMMSCMNLTAL